MRKSSIDMPASTSGGGEANSLSRLERLHSIQHMEMIIRRETSRADRNTREFSLVLFRIKRSKRHSVSTHRLIRTITARSRTTDEVGWFGDRHVCVVLPDTPLAGAWVFADSVCDLASKRIPRPVAIVYSYPGNWFVAGQHAQERGAGMPRLSTQTYNRQNDFDNNGGDGQGGPGGGRMQLAGLHEGHAEGAAAAAAQAVAEPQTVQKQLQRDGLMPFFMRGLTTGMTSEESAGSVEALLARPSPMWKRALDVTGAGIGVMLASPLMLFAYVGIKLTSPGPVIFTQQRAGLGGRPFTIYKFRTMATDAEARKKELRKISEQDGPAFKLTNDPRVFGFGSLLRKTSIDELPQLFNIIKGDMSLVGPRPLPIEEANACVGWQRRRLDVTPGLTCIWQIFGRSKVTFSEWVRMDVAYIRRRTIFHDLKLILMTIPAVLMRKGAK